jgi:hypothetical protein
MTRSNGSCSGGRAIRAARTRGGGVDHTAGRERPCCAACVNTAAHRMKADRGALRSTTAWTKLHCSNCVPSPTGTPIGITQTWTFMERTEHKPTADQNP